MQDAAEILVIILSVFLALFLILATILVVMLIKVTKQIKSVTTAAQSTVETANGFVATLSKTAAPAVISKYIAQAVTSFISKKKRK